MHVSGSSAADKGPAVDRGQLSLAACQALETGTGLFAHVSTGAAADTSQPNYCTGSCTAVSRLCNTDRHHAVHQLIETNARLDATRRRVALNGCRWDVAGRRPPNYDTCTPLPSQKGLSQHPYRLPSLATVTQSVEPYHVAPPKKSAVNVSRQNQLLKQLKKQLKQQQPSHYGHTVLLRKQHLNAVTAVLCTEGTGLHPGKECTGVRCHSSCCTVAKQATAWPKLLGKALKLRTG
jgi:hypothetical protein